MDRERFGERLGLARAAGPRSPDRDSGNPTTTAVAVVLGDERGDRLQVRGGARVDRADRHRQPAVVVGDRHSDPRVAQIQTEHAAAAA